jgi:signal transduction histidine kinase
VIIGYCYSLADQLRPNSAAVRELSELRSAAERAAALTHQLLAVSKRQLLSPKMLDLNDVVRGTQPLLQQTVGARIALDVSLDPQLPFVMVDQVQLEQVIVDLVANARDATPDGGKIRVATRRSTVEENGAVIDAVELSVSDNGRGMDAATSARIFEPFFTTRGPGVNGLGLATVYGIIEQSGGSITCKSAQGTGTKFVVTLPAVTIGAAPTAAPPRTDLIAHA